MIPDTGPVRVLIFIGSLRSGGKERRLIELLYYLKDKGGFEFMVVVTMDVVHYPDFFKLEVPYRVIKKRWSKNDPTVFYQFYKVCKEFKPDLVHTWGRIQTFYSLPSVMAQGIPLVNSQITSAPPNTKKWSYLKLIDSFNFRFSKVILSNSIAGLNSYSPPSLKSQVIYNGINMNRFNRLPCTDQIKRKYNITTPYTVVMSASFSPNKDYDLFYEVAEHVTAIREDVTFIGVGGCHDEALFSRLVKKASDNPRILFPGRIDDVEALVNACNIGVLFSNTSVHGEGISNSIMEYMALSKPVIANDAGGTREILKHNRNGYLIVTETAEQIAALVLDLLQDKVKCNAFGVESRRIIDNTFSIEKMGQAFEQVYKASLKYKKAPVVMKYTDEQHLPASYQS